MHIAGLKAISLNCIVSCNKVVISLNYQLIIINCSAYKQSDHYQMFKMGSHHHCGQKVRSNEGHSGYSSSKPVLGACRVRQVFGSNALKVHRQRQGAEKQLNRFWPILTTRDRQSAVMETWIQQPNAQRKNQKVTKLLSYFLKGLKDSFSGQGKEGHLRLGELHIQHPGIQGTVRNLFLEPFPKHLICPEDLNKVFVLFYQKVHNATIGP